MTIYFVAGTTRVVSIPRKHHFLPEWYLRRWAVDGLVTRFTRPGGPAGKLHCARKAPGGLAYQRDLYHLPDIADPLESQAIEHQFLQRIDDRAAIAVEKADRNERGSAADRQALSLFMKSLLFRTPSILEGMREELRFKTDGAPYEHATGEEFERLLKATTNRLFAELVASPGTTDLVTEFRVFVLRPLTGVSLLTSDRPISASRQLSAPDAFLTLPIGPERILILTRQVDIFRSFASQNPKALVEGLNAAIVEQANEIVVAKNTEARTMIDRLFLRPQPGSERDTIGLIRRKAPFVNLMPTRNFSRHRKRDMLYLGR